MTPYYQDDYCTIYHGDCREILPTLDKVDLVLTDPPYGIGESMGKNKSRSNIALAVDYGHSDWDAAIFDDIVLVLNSACHAAIFGGNYYDLPRTSCWLVWDKVNGRNDFADCELIWTNFKKAVRLKRHMWSGMLRVGQEYRSHPTQKPLSVMTWCIQQAPDTVETILDPFMGSGTTLRAAKDLGRKCVGIEIEEKYCEIAVERLRQEVLELC